MACYGYSQSYVTRGGGKNVVAVAAYNSATILRHERGGEAAATAAYNTGTTLEGEGRTFNFTGKQERVLCEGILAPENAPAWAHDRQQLWNRADQAERRCNARLARKLHISLHADLTPEQNRELLCDFLQQQFVSQGMVADFAIHAPDRDADQRHIHAHVLLTRRALTPDGFGAIFRDAEQGRALYLDRQAWEKHSNLALERAGSHSRVSAESIYARGVVREPEPVLGDRAVEEMRSGKHSRRGTLDERTQQRLNHVQQVRMRNQLRQQLDDAGQPHPDWLMQYYQQGRDAWMTRQEKRLARVQARGNTHFAAKLERMLDAAREKAAQIDAEHQRRQRGEARREVPAQQQARAAETPQAGATREPKDQASEQARHTGGTVPPDPSRPGFFQWRREERATGGSGEGRPHEQERAVEAPQARATPEPKDQVPEQASRAGSARDADKPRPSLFDRRGNRRATGETFLSVIDFFAAEYRSTFQDKSEERLRGWSRPPPGRMGKSGGPKESARDQTQERNQQRDTDRQRER